MGAICGAMLSRETLDPEADPAKFYQFGSDARFPPGVRFTPFED